LKLAKKRSDKTDEENLFIGDEYAEEDDSERQEETTENEMEGLYDLMIPPGIPESVIVELVEEFDLEPVSRTANVDIVEVDARESSMNLYTLLSAIKPPATTTKNQFLSRNSLFRNALAFMMSKLVLFQTIQFLYTRYNPIIASTIDKIFEKIDMNSRFSYMFPPSIKFFNYMYVTYLL